MQRNGILFSSEERVARIGANGAIEAQQLLLSL